MIEESVNFEFLEKWSFIIMRGIEVFIGGFVIELTANQMNFFLAKSRANDYEELVVNLHGRIYLL